MAKCDSDGIIEADFWDGMVGYVGQTDEALEKRFRSFTLKADIWLLNEWKGRADELRSKPVPWNTPESLARFDEVIGILERVIEERQ